MIKQIFVNLPVKDLPKAKQFWEKLGFEFNPQFSDEKGASLILGENIYAMLLTEEFFKTFIPDHDIVDTSKNKEILTAISVDSKEQVDEMIGKAVEAGGKEFKEAKDHGWMYYRDFEDLDGHVWEVMFMDITKFPGTEVDVAN